jgi:hypothetical protein
MYKTAFQLTDFTWNPSMTRLGIFAFQVDVSQILEYETGMHIDRPSQSKALK